MTDGAASAPAWRFHALLTLAFLIFALNIIVGRAVAPDIPPVGLSFWRWTVAALLLLPFSFARLRDQWVLLVRHWKLICAVSAVMIPLGNTLVYVGLQTTTALNGGLIPVSRPVIILILSWLLFRGSVTRHQWLGIAIAMVGVLLVVGRGDPAVFAGLEFVRGDLWLVASSIGIAVYQVLIGRVPKQLHPVVLLQATMVVGVIMLAPAYVWEHVAVRPVVPTLPALAAIAYVAVFPSICAIYLMNVAIVAVGPARAGIYNYLQPLLTAALAIPLLGETVRWYHPVALLLVVAGIVISSRAPRG